MDDVKKKVLLDLFASPWTVLPVVGGLTALMVSWAAGGSALLNTLGLVGILGGVGLLATRLIFGLERITNQAYEYLHQKQRQQQEQALDALDKKLKKDKDSRTQNSLRQLRHLYSSFQKDIDDGKLVRGAHEILDTVERLFEASVGQLRRSYELWTTARKLSGQPREDVLDERETVIQEVVDTVEHLSKTIQEFHTYASKRNDANLARLRSELDETMKVARRTEDRIASLGTNAFYDVDAFEFEDEIEDDEEGYYELG